MTIHVPLDVIHAAFFENLADLSEKIINDFLSCQVKHVLVSRRAWLASRNLHQIFGMLSVEFGIVGNHFRFKPKTELQPLFMHVICKMPES